jgi:hypothetical protein
VLYHGEGVVGYLDVVPSVGEDHIVENNPHLLVFLLMEEVRGYLNFKTLYRSRDPIFGVDEE